MQMILSCFGLFFLSTIKALYGSKRRVRALWCYGLNKLILKTWRCYSAKLSSKRTDMCFPETLVRDSI